MYLRENVHLHMLCFWVFFSHSACTDLHPQKKNPQKAFHPKWFSLILIVFIFRPRFLLFLNVFSMSLSTQGEEIFLDMFEDEYRSMTVG